MNLDHSLAPSARTIGTGRGSLPSRTGAWRPGSWLGRAVPRIRGPSDRGGATACTGGYSSEACVYRPPLACRYTASTPTRLSERQISRRRFQACTRTSAAQRSSCVHTLLDARGYIQATKRPCEWAGPDQALRVITRSPSHQGRVAPLCSWYSLPASSAQVEVR